MSSKARPARLLLAGLLFLGACGPRPGEKELSELRSVLAARNDNDPRLDGFRGLSPQAKALFRAEYRKLPRESLNQRGTIVYLLGRNLEAPEDWAFLKEVIAQPPCLSLADCSRKPQGPGQPGDAVTLAYPALVALEQAKAARATGRGEAAEVLEAARASPSPIVAKKASALR